jgi:hypothetical protein
MPSKYTLETIPDPDDSRIEFKEEKKPTNGSYEIFWKGQGRFIH